MIDVEPNLECECKFRAEIHDDFAGPLDALRDIVGPLRPYGGRERTAVYFERNARLHRAGLTLRCNRSSKDELRFQLKRVLELRGPMRISFEYNWRTHRSGLDLTDPFDRRLPVLRPVIEAAFDPHERDDEKALSELKPAVKMRVLRTAWIAMLPEAPDIPVFKVLIDRVQLLDLRDRAHLTSAFSELEIELDQEYPRAYSLAHTAVTRFAEIGYRPTTDGKCSKILRCT
jgi:hypothetical protein